MTTCNKDVYLQLPCADWFSSPFILDCVKESCVPEPQGLPDGLFPQVAVQEVL